MGMCCRWFRERSTLFIYLVEHPGELVGKGELLEAVWPDTVVEENNLNQSIAAIRRALGERAGEHKYIVTIPGAWIPLRCPRRRRGAIACAASTDRAPSACARGSRR